jgi:hypothetical protein
VADLSLLKIGYRTKDTAELVQYKDGGHEVWKPEIYVYSCVTATEVEALDTFMPLDSFVMAKNKREFLAFPCKGAAKVINTGVSLLYRVENGKKSHISDICGLCPDKVKKMFSGCPDCDSLKKIRQLHPMKIKNIEARVLKVDHKGLKAK